jgi:hypothetical protein
MAQVRREDEEAAAQEMRQKILNLARTAQREETQLSAATAYLNRVEGQPIARTLAAKVDDISSLDDRELLSELARFGGIPAEIAPRGAKASKPN